MPQEVGRNNFNGMHRGAEGAATKVTGLNRLNKLKGKTRLGRQRPGNIRNNANKKPAPNGPLVVG